MAVMYPRIFPPERFRDPKLSSERRVFEALRNQLDSEWHVFYNTPFQFRNLNDRTSDGEADFILIHPYHHILCLEVKGGQIFSNPDGEMMLRLNDGTEKKIKSPKEQARVAKHFLLRELPTHLSGATPSIHDAICLPSIYNAPDRFRGIDPAEILCAPDLSRISDKILDIITYHQGNATRMDISSVLLEACKKVLLPPENLGTLLTTRILSAEHALINLTNEQKQLLFFLRRYPKFAVAGGPGTGKTVIAFEQAKWLAQQGRRVLFTCFNSPLAEKLSSQASSSHIDVINFHNLCNRATGSTGVNISTEATAQAISSGKILKYDSIVVDEGQNFEKVWWQVLEKLLKSESGEFQVFYDHHQALYPDTNHFPSVFGIRSADDLAPDGWLGYELELNVRNTRNIASVAQSLFAGMRMNLNDVEGDEIEFRPYKDVHKQVGKKLAELEQSGVPMTEIVVLTGKNHQYIKDLQAAGDNCFGDKRWSNTATLNHGFVYFETARRFQGLDSPVVILIDPERILDKPSALLVALTRAKSHLTIVAHPDSCVRLMSLLNLTSIVNEMPTFQKPRNKGIEEAVRRSSSNQISAILEDPFAVDDQVETLDKKPTTNIPPNFSSTEIIFVEPTFIVAGRIGSEYRIEARRGSTLIRQKFFKLEAGDGLRNDIQNGELLPITMEEFNSSKPLRLYRKGG